MVNIKELVDALAPMLVYAGQYSLRIQPHVENFGKDGSGPINVALTAADLSVEAFLEVFLLAQFPEVRFFGEEHIASKNSHFFDQDSKVVVTCDPINGTLSYSRNRSEYEIIISVYEEGKMVAALIHKPHEGLLYTALTGGFPSVQTDDDVLWNLSGLPAGFFSDTKKVIWTTLVSPVVRQELESHGYEIMDYSALSKLDTGNIALPTPAAILSGGIAAFFRERPMIIDTVATAFVAKEMKATVIDYRGREIEFVARDFGRIDNIICANSPELAQLICSAVS